MSFTSWDFWILIGLVVYLFIGIREDMKLKNRVGMEFLAFLGKTKKGAYPEKEKED